MVAEICASGLASSTAIILSAKHGQSPTDPSDLARVADAPIIAALNAAWTAAHPYRRPGGVLHRRRRRALWLSDRTQAAAHFVKKYLLTHSAAGTNINGSPETVHRLGADQGLRGLGVGGVLRRTGTLTRAPRHLRHRSGRHRLYGRHQQDRRTRRRQPRTATSRSWGRSRPADDQAIGARSRPPRSPHDPEAPPPQPESAPGCADRAHQICPGCQAAGSTCAGQERRAADPAGWVRRPAHLPDHGVSPVMGGC